MTWGIGHWTRYTRGVFPDWSVGAGAGRVGGSQADASRWSGDHK
jgi:hypothetical protein